LTTLVVIKDLSFIRKTQKGDPCCLFEFNLKIQTNISINQLVVRLIQHFKMEFFMTIFTLFSTFPLGNEGFGFNGNILETNIINLSVVIGVVVSLGGDALRSLLDTRKETILKNFEEAKQRSEEAREKLALASQEVENAKIKANEITQQTASLLEKERQMYAQQLESETKRLATLKEETLTFQEQRAKFQISNQIIALAVEKVEQTIKSRLTPRLHDSVNNFNILLLGKMS
jgi:F-type H+-transporting ATPase subunit b